jgi:hypothetical protein
LLAFGQLRHNRAPLIFAQRAPLRNFLQAARAARA